VAYKIFFTEDALSDLEVVLDFISADNPSAAGQFGTSLLNQVELLRSLPRISSGSASGPEQGDPGHSEKSILAADKHG
jgi:plasmid stabilization system protein ParE